MQFHTGKFKASELISFLSKQAGSAASSEADDSSAPQGPEKGSGQKQKQEEKKDPKIVRDLNMTEFEELSDEEDAWLVAFYSGAVTCHCSPAIIFRILTGRSATVLESRLQCSRVMLFGIKV